MALPSSPYESMRVVNICCEKILMHIVFQVSVLNDRVNEAMLLKFGQIVDLEKLEVLSSNPIIDERRQQLRELELQANREMAWVQEKIDQKKRELVRMVKENTQRLNRMHDLITTRTQMEERLDARQRSMVSEGREGGKSRRAGGQGGREGGREGGAGAGRQASRREEGWKGGGGGREGGRANRKEEGWKGKGRWGGWGGGGEGGREG